MSAEAMTTEAVRQAIVARLRSVKDAGPVHPYERFAARDPDLRAFYAPGGAPLRGWYVRRVGEERFGYDKAARRMRVVTPLASGGVPPRWTTKPRASSVSIPCWTKRWRRSMAIRP